MVSDESRAKGWSQDGFTLCHENVNLPRLHGNERLVDGIDLDEDQGLRRFARLLIVVSDELDPAAQVFPKGEPDRPHAILECQFEKGEVLGPRFLELPPEKTGADGERTRGPAERRPCDGELVPEFLDPCVGWMVVPHTSFSPITPCGLEMAMPHLVLVLRIRSRRREKLRWQVHRRSPRPLERAQLEFGCLKVVLEHIPYIHRTKTCCRT